MTGGAAPRWRVGLQFLVEDPVTAKLNLVTGATGLLGSHIVEALVRRGERVRALVRPTSDARFLRDLNVELVQGDLRDAASLVRAVAGAEIVYHCAARVGDWAPRRVYQQEVIDATRKLLDACSSEGVRRVLYVSSVTVYGHPRPECREQLTEESPLGQRLFWFWDRYCRSKIKAEEIARGHGTRATIVRPGWMYGPRDRNTLPRLILGLRSGRVMGLIGSGENLLNLIDASDVAEGAILAANHAEAGGQAYNLCTEGEFTQREFLDTVTDFLGLPRRTRHMPFRFALWSGLFSEIIGRAIFLKRPPHVTRYGVSLFGRPCQFSIAKARRQLGWEPKVKGLEGVRSALAWLRGRGLAGAAPERPSKVEQVA
jgi:2-alkyl-3-oxoalkanoate reductase